LNKKIASGVIVFLLILTTSLPIAIALNVNIGPLNEIENIDYKILKYDGIIGNLHVKYWTHEVNGINIQNDSILLHLSIEDENVIKYEKTWSDLDITFSDYEDLTFEPEDSIGQKLVIFPDKDDLMNFYSFFNTQDYPLICWEVWYSDGSTLLYNLDEEIIGYGVPMPIDGFSLSGWHWIPGEPDDPWKYYRTNANMWFEKWLGSTESISHPRKSTLSSYVSNPSVTLFYEIAHGDFRDFLLNDKWERYYFSTAYDDMKDRQPMRFAFIGSCNAMDETGEDTFSHSFRKGQMTDTVTIGYTEMSQDPWKYSFSWQIYLFTKMDEENTIYDSFIAACAQYPAFEPVVKFVGDETITVFNKTRTVMPSFITNPFLLKLIKQFPIFERLINLI